MDSGLNEKLRADQRDLNIALDSLFNIKNNNPNSQMVRKQWETLKTQLLASIDMWENYFVPKQEYGVTLLNEDTRNDIIVNDTVNEWKPDISVFKPTITQPVKTQKPVVTTPPPAPSASNDSNLLQPIGIHQKVPADHWIRTFKTEECRFGDDCDVLKCVRSGDKPRRYIYQCCGYHHDMDDRIRVGAANLIKKETKCHFPIGHRNNKTADGRFTGFNWFNVNWPNKSCGYQHGGEVLYSNFKKKACPFGDDCVLKEWDFEDIEGNDSPCSDWHHGDSRY